MIKFNVDGWYGALIMLPDNYLHLANYVKSKKLRKSYLDSIRFIDIDLSDQFSNTNDTVENEMSDDDRKLVHLGYVDTAFQRYSNQILAVLVSYLEQMIKEFLEVYYYYYPTKMRQIYGYIDLSQFLNCKTNIELLTRLSKAAAEAVRGGIMPKIKKIEELTGKKIDKKLINRLNRLVKKRNDIVHNDNLYDINYSSIEKNSKDIIELLKQLGLILKSNKIPVIANFRLLDY